MTKSPHAPTFAELAESGRMALLRVFAPKVAEEIVELRASGVAERLAEELYGCISFSDIEERYLQLLESAAKVDGGLVLLAERASPRSFEHSLRGLHQAPEELRKRHVSDPITAGRQWLTDRWAVAFDSSEENLYDVEQMLLRYYWALAHPALLRTDERLGLLIYAGTLREGMPDLWKARLDGAGWPAPALSAFGHLLHGRLRDALKAPAGFPTVGVKHYGQEAA
jgi:hypothetical protein